MLKDFLPEQAPRGIHVQDVASVLKLTKPRMVLWWQKEGFVEPSGHPSQDSRYYFHDVVQAYCAKALLSISEDHSRQVVKFRPTSREVKEQLLEVKLYLLGLECSILDATIYLGHCGEVMVLTGSILGDEDFLGRYCKVSVREVWKRTEKVLRTRLPKDFSEIFFEASEKLRRETHISAQKLIREAISELS